LPNLLNKFKGAIAGFRDPTALKTLAGPTPVIVDQWRQYIDMLNVSMERKDIHDDMEKLDKNDPLIVRALEVKASRAVGVKTLWDSVIEVECEDEKIKKDMEEDLLIASCQDPRETKGRIYRMRQFGNDFYENLIGSDFKLKELHWLKREQYINVNLDEFGYLKNGDPNSTKERGICAYDMQNSVGTFIAGFWPWQITHFHTGKIDYYGYGVPDFLSIRQIDVSLNYLHTLMVIAAMAQTMGVIVHQVPTKFNQPLEGIEKDFEDYKLNLRTRQSPILHNTTLSRDRTPNQIGGPPNEIYLPLFLDLLAQNPQMPQANVTFHEYSTPLLQNMAHVRYFQQLKMSALGVPPSYLGFEKDVNAKATLTTEEIQFQNDIAGMQMDYIASMIPLIKILQFCRGRIDLPKFKLVMQSPFVLTEEQRVNIENTRSQTIERYIRTRFLSRRYLRQDELNMTDEENNNEEQTIVDEMDVYPTLGPSTVGLTAGESAVEKDLHLTLKELKENIKDFNGHRRNFTPCGSRR